MDWLPGKQATLTTSLPRDRLLDQLCSRRGPIICLFSSTVSWLVRGWPPVFWTSVALTMPPRPKTLANSGQAPDVGGFDPGGCARRVLERCLYRRAKRASCPLSQLNISCLFVCISQNFSGALRPVADRHSTGEEACAPLQESCLENPADRGAWRATSVRSQRIRCEWSELACADSDREKSLTAGGCGAARKPEARKAGMARQSETISLLREGSGPCEGLPLTRQARGAGPGSLGQWMDDVNNPRLPAAPRWLLTQGRRRVPPRCAPGSSRTLFSSFVCSGMRQGLGAWSAHLLPPTPAA